MLVEPTHQLLRLPYSSQSTLFVTPACTPFVSVIVGLILGLGITNPESSSD